MTADDPEPPLAVFDFDGTLTRRDTFRMFLVSCAGGRAAIVRAFAKSPLLTLRGLRGGLARNRAKERMLVRVLGGRPGDEVDAVAAALAQHILERELRADTVARLRWHQAEGHEVVIVSASFDRYVRAVSEALGVGIVFATGWELDGQGRLTGRMEGPNVRGPQKAALLRQFLGGKDRFVYAYGDSPGDRELLAMAHVAVLVGTEPIPAAPPGSGGPTA
jgi:phosphatidylglycerophosphatase C